MSQSTRVSTRPPIWQVSLEQGVRYFLQWYGEYYGVRLPPSMAPNRREATELRSKYGIDVTVAHGRKGNRRGRVLGQHSPRQQG